MSGICGIFDLTGEPVKTKQLERMNSVMPHLGPDGAKIWSSGPIGMGQQYLWTTRESVQEILPLTCRRRRFWLVMDGRVDNRHELRKTLQLHGYPPRGNGDAELVLCAYECWGQLCLTHILGDFALAIWDDVQKVLFCARDCLGIKPLYYHSGPRTFAWATEHSQLLMLPGVSNSPDEGMVGEMLACSLRSREDTLYRDIKRLPAAHSLLVSREGISRRRYWDVDPRFQTHYVRQAEYVEHFQEILTSAIKCRLRSHKPVATELSGGVDSSSIFVLAEKMHHMEGGELQSYALVFPGVVTCDESTYIAAVAKHSRGSFTALETSIESLEWFREKAAVFGDFPWLPHGANFDQLRTLASERGCAVLLNGMGGDEWLTGSTLHYADYLRKFSFRSLMRQLRADLAPAPDSRLVPAVTLPKMILLRCGVWPLMPGFVKKQVRGLRGLAKKTSHSWINASFANSIDLHNRLQPKPTRRGFDSFAQEAIYQQLNDGWMYQGNEWAHHHLAALGIELRSPFMDRNLIEFALSLPEEWRWKGSQTKYILRESMRGFLPESVRLRRTKGDFSHIFAETMSAVGFRNLVENMAVEQLGWVDGAQVRAMYLTMMDRYRRGDLRYVESIWPLWMIFGIELWYTSARR